MDASRDGALAPRTPPDTRAVDPASEDLIGEVAGLELDNQDLRDRASMLRSELAFLDGASITAAERAATLAEATRRVEELRRRVAELQGAVESRERAIAAKVRRQRSPLASEVMAVLDALLSLVGKGR